MNYNLQIAITEMKRDIVKNGGSCIFIIANDGELMQMGGGESAVMMELLKNTIQNIEKDSGGIIRTI
jgi:hypothetical protein